MISFYSLGSNVYFGFILEQFLWKPFLVFLFGFLFFRLINSSRFFIVVSFEFTFIDFFTGFCFEIPCSSVSHFVETSYCTFIAIKVTGSHVMQDLSVGNLETNDKQFSICLYMCFYACGYMYMFMWTCIRTRTL